MTDSKLLSPFAIKRQICTHKLFSLIEAALIRRYNIGLSLTAKKKEKQTKKATREKKTCKQSYNPFNLGNPNTHTQHFFCSSKTQNEANNPKQKRPNPIKPKKGKQKKPKNKSENLGLIRSY